MSPEGKLKRKRYYVKNSLSLDAIRTTTVLHKRTAKSSAAPPASPDN